MVVATEDVKKGLEETSASEKEVEAQRETEMEAQKQEDERVIAEAEAQRKAEEENEMSIPRYRLNEELDKRHRAEEKVVELSTEVERLKSQDGAKRDAEGIEQEIKQIAEDTNLSEEALKKIFNLQSKFITMGLRERDEVDSVLIAKSNIRQFIGEYPKAKQYQAEIEKRLLNLSPHLRKDPEIPKEIYRYIMGSRLEQIEKDAEARGKKKSDIKTILSKSGASADGTTTMTSTTAKKVSLTDGEKEIAKKSGMTEEEYAKYKAKRDERAR